ncbi:MAG: tetratricopeptide repeat protein [Fimbriimonadaceae bacterium]
MRAWLAGCVAALAVVGCIRGAGTIPIANDREFNNVLAQAERLSKRPLEVARADGELTQQEKADLERARPMFASMIRYRPDAFALRLGAGKIEAALGDWEAALRQLDACRSLINPQTVVPAERVTLAEAWFETARANLALQRPEPAERAARQAVLIVPQAPDYHAALAAALLALGRRQEARTAVDEALRLDPAHPRAKSLSERLGPRPPAPAEAP